MNLFKLNLFISLFSSFLITIYLVIFTDIGWEIVILPISIIIISLMVIHLKVRSKSSSPF